MTQSNRGGRPTLYTKELAEEICDTIACNSDGIKKLCDARDHWPCEDTIYTWLMKYSEFSELYAKAKIIQTTVLVDEILEIADNTSQDHIVNDEGKVISNSEWINRSRLRIDTRKWLASKLVPKVYGDRIQNETTLTLHEKAIKELREFDE